MDKAKMLEIVKSKPQFSSLTDLEIEWFIDSAIRKCLRLAYPVNLNKTVDDISYPFYEGWVIDATIAMIQNVGIGNIKSYSENGLSVSYEEMTDGIPKTLENEIIPFGRSVSNE